MPRNRSKPVKLQCHPLTPERWADVETLFGERGACGGCWCMVWRMTRKDFEANKGDGNRQAIRKQVLAGRVPGILAYVGVQPIGWCSVAPREEFSALDRSRVLKRIDDRPVWSVSCLFVRKDYRKKGVSIELLRAAIEYVRSQGGSIVEGYPVEPYAESIPAAFAWTGLAAAFLEAGFVEAKRHSPSRPIMRYTISVGKKQRSRTKDQAH